MATVGLSSVVCAFAFTSRMSTGLEDSDIVIEELNETSDGQLQGVTEGQGKGKGNKKNNITDDKNAEKSGDISDIINDDDIADTKTPGEDKGNIIIPLESIVANLGGAKSKRYLRVLINLEVADDKAKKIVKEKTVIIRDNLISYFSMKTANDVEADGSVFKLRLEIKNSLNKILGHDKIIKQVYFSDFIVQ